MAFFDLEDKTGIIEVCCFTKAYEKFGMLLEEDSVVKLNGYLNEKELETYPEAGSEEQPEPSDEETKAKETYFSFVIDSVKEMQPDLNDIRITINQMSEWNPMLERLKKKDNLCKSGHPLTIYDRLNGEFRSTFFYIKEDVLNDASILANQSA